MIKAFALCTLPAMTAGQAWSQDDSFVPPAVDQVLTSDFVADDEEVGSAKVSPVQHTSEQTAERNPFLPPNVDEIFTPTGTIGGEDDGVARVGSSDEDDTNAIEQANYVGPITASADPYSGSVVSGDALGYAVADDPSLVMWRLTRDNHEIAGVPRGWTGLSAFVPLGANSPNDIYFLNPRVLIDDDGRAGGNIGFGNAGSTRPRMPRMSSPSGVTWTMASPTPTAKSVSQPRQSHRTGSSGSTATGS